MQAVILAGIPPEEHAATRALLDEARLHFVKVVNCDRCHLHTWGKTLKFAVNKSNHSKCFSACLHCLRTCTLPQICPGMYSDEYIKLI